LSEVKVDGYVNIHKDERYHTSDYLTRVGEQLEVLIKQLDYATKQLEQIVYMLSMITKTYAIAAPTPASPITMPGPSVPTPGKVMALPFRAKPIGTAKYTATEGNVLELSLTGDAFIIVTDSDVYIGERRDAQNFLLVAGSYLTVYRPAGLDKLYVRSAEDSATIYIMYLQIVDEGEHRLR